MSNAMKKNVNCNTLFALPLRKLNANKKKQQQQQESGNGS